MKRCIKNGGYKKIKNLIGNSRFPFQLSSALQSEFLEIVRIPIKNYFLMKKDGKRLGYLEIDFGQG